MRFANQELMSHVHEMLHFAPDHKQDKNYSRLSLDHVRALGRRAMPPTCEYVDKNYVRSVSLLVTGRGNAKSSMSSTEMRR